MNILHLRHEHVQHCVILATDFPLVTSAMLRGAYWLAIHGICRSNQPPPAPLYALHTGVSFNRHRTRNDGALSSYAENWCNPFISVCCGICSLFPFNDNVSRANNKYWQPESNINGRKNAYKLTMHERTRKENMEIWKMRDNSCTAEIYNLAENERATEKYSIAGVFQCSMHDRLLQTRSPPSHILLRCANADSNDKLRTDEKFNEKQGKMFKYLPFI